MNDYKNFCEYVIRPQPTIKTKLARGFLLAFYTLFCVGYLFLFWVMLKQWLLLLLLPFILLGIYKLTWKYVDVEYDVALEAGELTVSAIYGGASRRVKCRAYVPDMTLIARLDERIYNMLEARDMDSVKRFTIGDDGVMTYVCIYPDGKRGKKQALIIDATDELIRAMRICNPALFAGSVAK